MKSDEFAALAARYAKYSESKHVTKGAGGDALRREIQQVFARTAEENAALLSGDDLGTKADTGRKFDQNLRQLQMIKTWLEQMNEDAQPAERAPLSVRTGGSASYGAGRGKSYGGSPLVMPTETLKELHEAAQGRKFASKAITVTGVPQAAMADYVTGVWPMLRDKVRLRELIPTQDTDRTSVVYYRGLTAASAADTVAEGADKPESSPTWESVTVPIRKIAHYGKINDEVIADYPAWMQVIGEEFIAGIIDAENDQILNGSGVAPDLVGLLNTSGVQTQAFATDIITTLATAANKLRTGAAFTEPDTFILSPADWLAITLLRTGGSTTTDGPFLVNPLTTPPLQLWGTQVVVTNRIATGTAVVANLATAAEIFVRQDVTFEVHPGGGGEAEWKANKTLVRAEERIALTVPRPKAVVIADLAA